MVPINKIKALFNKRYLSVGLFIGLDIVFLVFVSYLGYKVYGIYQETRSFEQEIDQLKTTSLLIKNNKNLLQDNISSYNDILDALIPDGETYFQVISALEQLEARNGVRINSYSINLSETTEEKMSLSLTISGPQNTIESLLDNYHYSSGRLITNEEITYSMGNTETISFAINVFHSSSDQPNPESDVAEIIIANEDIEFIQSIQERL